MSKQNHVFSHGFSAGDEVTVTVNLSGHINGNGGLEFDYTMDKDWSFAGMDQQDFCSVVENNGDDYIHETDLRDNKKALSLRKYGEPLVPPGPPITDDDIKDAVASILGRKA